ncbi:MAG TPA: peptidyl-prolyl cis-trans isomerase [Kofleriaceae bacterium]|nr:peptidyl-prolyl cis-trans isomerase [Kofleriaceae bacterium]
MRLAAGLAVLALAATSCGERAAPPPPPAATEGPAVLRAEPAGRSVVATVDGEPVYDDCVARQAAAHGVDARAALDECVDFELLAQEAARRGLAADPDVALVRRTEMVRALVGADYVSTMDEPSDIPDADLHALWDRTIRHLYNRPERRRATYCRVPIGAKQRGTPADAEARALASRIHRAMGRSIDAERFAATCTSAGDGKTELPEKALKPFAASGQFAGGRNVPEFTAAAFSVPAGRPAEPVRTRWGWDIVLTTEVLPAATRSFEDAEAEVREKLLRSPETAEYRIGKFAEWVRARLAGAHVELHADALRADAELAAP